MSTYYTIKRKDPFTSLKRRWASYQKKYDTVVGEKQEINKYIHFLHYSERYSKSEIAEQLQLSRERIGQIIQVVDKQLTKGGDHHD